MHASSLNLMDDIARYNRLDVGSEGGFVYGWC